MANFDLSAFGGLFKNSIFWTLLTLFVLFMIVIIVLSLRKRNTLCYASLGIIPLGEGKVQYEYDNRGAGYFGKHFSFGKLLWSGTEVMRIKDGRIVHGFSPTDFHYAKGKKCVAYVQVPLNRKLLAPVQNSELKELDKQYDLKDTVFMIQGQPHIILPSTQTSFKNWNYISELPTGDMSDALVHMVTETDQEMHLRKNPLAQMIAIGIIAIVILAIFFINNQRAQTLDDRATKIGLMANTEGFTQCKELCHEAVAGLTIQPAQNKGGAP